MMKFDYGRLKKRCYLFLFLDVIRCCFYISVFLVALFSLVHEVQKAILADSKCKLPGLSAIIYFTDGCAGQYKN